MTAREQAIDPAEYAAEWPRVVGATLRAFGDLELAEDSAQEAFLRAAERLAAGEAIAHLGAWATTAARRIAIDALRRDTVFRSKLPLCFLTMPRQRILLLVQQTTGRAPASD